MNFLNHNDADLVLEEETYGTRLSVFLEPLGAGRDSVVMSEDPGVGVSIAPCTVAEALAEAQKARDEECYTVRIDREGRLGEVILPIAAAAVEAKRDNLPNG